MMRNVIDTTLCAVITAGTSARLRAIVPAAPLLRQLVGGLAWSVGAVAGERLIGVVQAFYVARLLGIEEFGKYGLIFVTVGLLGSLIGLQLGLTVAVNVARQRVAAPERAAAIIRLCETVSFALAGVAFAFVLLTPVTAAKLLLGDKGSAGVVVAGSAITALSVIAGVQEGVLQGLEEFRGLALLRTGTALLTLLFLLVLARPGDLDSVFLALVAATVLRTLALLVVKEKTVRRLGLRTTPALLLESWSVLISFSLPALLGSVLSGGVNWLGVYLVSHVENGFREVAVLTAGQQWRGLALYLASISAGVAIPMMSRLGGTGETDSVRQIHLANLLANVGGATLFVAALGFASGTVLNLYGSEFADYRLTFWAVAATTVPAVWANVFLQYLVSLGRMWHQFLLYLSQSLALVAGYPFLVGRYGALGFAIWTGIIGLAFCLVLTFSVRVAATSAAKSKSDG